MGTGVHFTQQVISDRRRAARFLIEPDFECLRLARGAGRRNLFLLHFGHR